MSTKIVSIQILRACCAWAIVIHHCNQIYFSWQPENSLLRIFNLAYLGVDVFFVISGYIMAHTVLRKNYSASQFLRKRIVRVFKPYWAVSMIYLLLLYSFSDYTTSTSELIASFLLIPNDFDFHPILYVGWSLVYEIFFYLLCTIPLVLPKIKYSGITVYLLIVFAFFPAQTLNLGSGNYFLLEFAIGYSLSAGRELNRYGLNAALLLLAIFLISYNEHIILLRILISSAIMVVFLLFEDKIKRIEIRSVMNLGKISYSTYLVHPCVILGLSYVEKIGIFKYELFLVSITIFGTYIASELSFKFFEKSYKISY